MRLDNRLDGGPQGQVRKSDNAGGYTAVEVALHATALGSVLAALTGLSVAGAAAAALSRRVPYAARLGLSFCLAAMVALPTPCQSAAPQWLRWAAIAMSMSKITRNWGRCRVTVITVTQGAARSVSQHKMRIWKRD